MPQLEKDIDIVTNVGGVLNYWNTINGNQGALTGYPNTPVGGPPGEDFDADVRELDEIEMELEIPGDDAATRAAFVDRFAQGTTFDCKATASTSGEMAITGIGRIGRRYYVSKAPQTKNKAGNTVLNVTLREQGATPEA